jgi:hypothetical protein
MKEQGFGLAVYLLGYPIAWAVMIAFYASAALRLRPHTVPIVSRPTGPTGGRR